MLLLAKRLNQPWNSNGRNQRLRFPENQSFVQKETKITEGTEGIAAKRRKKRKKFKSSRSCRSSRIGARIQESGDARIEAHVKLEGSRFVACPVGSRADLL